MKNKKTAWMRRSENGLQFSLIRGGEVLYWICADGIDAVFAVPRLAKRIRLGVSEQETKYTQQVYFHEDAERGQSSGYVTVTGAGGFMLDVSMDTVIDRLGLAGKTVHIYCEWE